MIKKIVLATGNKGKINELRTLLTDFPLEIVTQQELGVDDIEETGLTFIENAILKARHAAKVTGLPAIADDSGLAVEYLQGNPGIYSARYSAPNATDKKNIDKLLEALKNIPEHQRQAQFHCVLAFLKHETDPTPIICHGIWQGMIAQQPCGNDGFGYDPIFYIPTLQCCAAQLNQTQKNSLSHRGKALKQLLEALRGH